MLKSMAVRLFRIMEISNGFDMRVDADASSKETQGFGKALPAEFRKIHNNFQLKHMREFYFVNLKIIAPGSGPSSQDVLTLLC